MTTEILQRSVRTHSIKFADGDSDPRQITVVATDATPDRMSDIVDPAGARLDNFRRNPVVLAQHDTTQPIARCSSIGMQGSQIVAKIQFPPAGVNQRSDEYLGMVRAGILSAVSIGFMPISGEPIRGGGYRYTDWELYELSIVSVPANPSALVTERSLGDPASAARLARALDLQRSLSRPWPHPAAAEPTEAEMIATARRLALRQLHDTADLDTAAGRAAHARRLRSHYAADGAALAVDPRAAVAAAVWWCALLW